MKSKSSAIVVKIMVDDRPGVVLYNIGAHNLGHALVAL